MSKPWADQPFKLVPIPGTPGVPTVRFSIPSGNSTNRFQSENPGAHYVAWDMANAHNGLIRQLNAIYLQCEHVHEPQDVADMLFYIKIWGDGVHHHHRGEENDLFPKLDLLANEAGIEGNPMNANIEQHHEFDKGMHQLEDYVTEVQAGTKTYDGKIIKACIDSFGPVFTDHLHAEITTLLSLEVCDSATLKKTFTDMVDRAVKGADVVSSVQEAPFLALTDHSTSTAYCHSDSLGRL
jgi:hemerythrin-like domain-containing protein